MATAQAVPSVSGRLQQLQASLKETANEGVFAIGGSLHLDSAAPLQLLIKCNADSAVQQPATSSIASAAPLVQPTLCWQLPPPDEQQWAEDTQQLMQAILAQCNAATFGKGGETVLDTAYRFAYQLPPSRFVTSFHPAQPGCSILADVSRMLAPGQSSLLSPPIVQAELYSLNVYTAGGHFKAHVDTPRGDNMFGSLVVCLPVPHQGGQLTVRHGGEQRVFDWSFAEAKEGAHNGEAGDDKRQQLQWAAFFGNCEHEVAAVTSGYRCTLTYNLYQLTDTARTRASAVGQSTPLSRQALMLRGVESASPLVRSLAEALTDGVWMTKGGVVGIKCGHGHIIITAQSTYDVKHRPLVLTIR